MLRCVICGKLPTMQMFRIARGNNEGTKYKRTKHDFIYHCLDCGIRGKMCRSSAMKAITSWNKVQRELKLSREKVK